MELPLAHGQSQFPPISNISIPQSSLKTPHIRKYLSMDTPPCAQPSQTVIPGTEMRNPSPQPGQDAQRPRSRPMKPIQFTDPTNASPSAPANASKSFQRMASTRKYVNISSSNGTSSSSLGPTSTHTGTPQHESSEPSATQPIPSPVAPHQSSQSHEAGVDFAEVKATQEQPASLELLPHTPQDFTAVAATQPVSMELEYTQAMEPQVLKSVEPDELSVNEEKTPFEVFASVYPSYVEKYSGGLGVFVRACICLEHMSKLKTLNHCLWDDFIRSFSAEYLTYARNTRRALPASEWYNDRDEEPLYNEKVVRKSNLQLILNQHDSRVTQERQHIKLKREGSKNRVSVDVHAERPNPTTPASQTSSKHHSMQDPARRGRQSAEGTSPQVMGPPLPRAISHSTSEMESDQRGTRHASGNIGAHSFPTVDPKRHSTGIMSVASVSSTSASPVTSQVPRPPSFSQRSSSSKSALGAYMRSLSKPRSTKEREKIRQHIKRPSTGVSNSSEE